MIIYLAGKIIPQVSTYTRVIVTITVKNNIKTEQ